MTSKEIAKLKLEKNEALCCVWNDILSESGWHDRPALDKATPPEIKTLGFYGATISGISVSVFKHTIDFTGDESDFTTIPIGEITRIRKLKIKEKI